MLEVFQLMARGHVVWDEDLKPAIKNATFAKEDDIWGCLPPRSECGLF